MGVNKSKGSALREKLREQFWRDEDAWTGEDEKGWFSAPRTLPLVLGLLASKELSGRCDPTRVYVELWARHMSGGVIEVRHEGDHAYAAGYVGSRAIRTWQERIKLLERNGFIKTKHVGNQRYKYVLLIHPTKILDELHSEGKIPDQWWDTYCARQIETGELTLAERKKRSGTTKSLPPVSFRIGGKKVG
jgi:hypothetical protein